MDSDDADGLWMTYGQLAESRQISRTSAQRLARRRKWRRQTDNRGITRVYVPHLATEPQVTPEGRQPDIPRADGALAAAYETALKAKDQEIAAKDSLITELRQGVQRAELAASVAQERINQLEQVESASTELRQRAETAEATVAELRAGGRWARIRRAWRRR